jgi:hypothetical protein
MTMQALLVYYGDGLLSWFAKYVITIYWRNKVISWHALHEVNHVDYTRRVRGAKIKFSHTKIKPSQHLINDSPMENNLFIPSRTYTQDQINSYGQTSGLLYCESHQNITESYFRQGRDEAYK